MYFERWNASAHKWRSCIALVVIGSATTAHGGLSLYYTTDEDATHQMPTDAPDDPWDKVNDDGTVTLALGFRDRIWFAARNDDDPGREKYVALRVMAPTPPDMDALQPCTLGDEDAEGFLGPDDSFPVRTVFGGARTARGKYAVNYRMVPQPTWERFCFKCMSPAGINGEFTFDLFTTCSSPLELPPLSGFFAMTNTTFGAPGAMIGEPNYTEITVFPRSLSVDPDQLATIAAPPETGPWVAELVLVDPDGVDRPLGGYVYRSDGVGLSVFDTFDLHFGMSGASDHEYDLYAFDATSEQYDRLTIAGATLRDDLDAYDVGPLVGLGGWEPWDLDPAFGDFVVTDEPVVSGPHSLAIDVSDDAVRRLHGYVSGVWAMSARQYVPASFEGQQFFILLNTYEPGGPKNWSLQLVADGETGLLTDFDSGEAVALVTDAWAEIRVVIDLDADRQSVFYDGTLMGTKSWTEGASGGGVPQIAALNLFANGSPTAVYYDDLDLSRIPAAGQCVFEDGSCEVVYASACDMLGGTYAGHDTVCPEVEECPSDVNGDGVVDLVDLLAILAAWGVGDGDEDINGDGIVNLVDLLMLLAAWGECS